ncbi:alpha/beta hydrolase-fold protein [Fodinicola acaciae]|uniref:alpha/beta hydrolase-fold protein n=1 Tax=Fodinicola acaciae TaxID=2681555 RepID=UPI0013D4A524|nr:alpha/beta hydrolase-fold protein [Fodinicola acaciae]
MNLWKRTAIAAAAAVVATAGLSGSAYGHRPLEFDVSVSPQARTAPVDGRVLVVVTKDGSTDPITQTDIVGGVPFWGRDVDGLRPGRPVSIGMQADVYGHPLSTLDKLPAGDYHVQAFLNTYDTFHRADGPAVKLHMPCGDGQDMFSSPGNLYSTPKLLHLDPRRSGPVPLRLDHIITPASPVPPGGTCQQGNPADSAHVKHVKILSRSLSTFWGRPIYIGANVLLPAGYDENPGVRYPVEYAFGHFSTAAPHGFREDGGNAFSKWWLSASAPRFISVTFREENPFYDSSYMVDSPNVGPYGTATNRELLPEIDKEFRTIAQPWARVTSGGSTGGWESLASLVSYPDVYGGAFTGYPDPVDFHRYQIVDIYNDANGYFVQHEWDQVAKPDSRTPAGDIQYTNADENHYELARGNRDRSEGAWAVWEAVFGPRGADGYPAQVWDKKTGQIDHTVAAQWQSKDIRAYLASHWSTLGPQLRGKIYVYVGDTDTYYLNDAVELLQQQLQSETSPPADATFVYGRAKPHGWSPYTTQQWFDIYAAYVAAHAPAGTAMPWRGHEIAPQAQPSGGIVQTPPSRIPLR